MVAKECPHSWKVMEQREEKEKGLLRFATGKTIRTYVMQCRNCGDIMSRTVNVAATPEPKEKKPEGVSVDKAFEGMDEDGDIQ